MSGLGLVLAAALAASASDVVDLQPVMVKPGDTLWSISQTYLKDPAKWDEILKYNSLPSTDPTLALPGMSLKIPVRSIKTELQAARVIFIRNEAAGRRQGASEWRRLAEQAQVVRGDSVRTGADSELIVKFIDNSLLQLRANAEAVVAPAGNGVELKKGEVMAAGKTVSVAGAAVAASAGAIYTASMMPDKTALIQVAEGAASVTASGRTVQVRAGMASELRRDEAPSSPFRAPDLERITSLAASLKARLAAAGGRTREALSRAVSATVAAPEAPKADLGTIEPRRNAVSEVTTLDPISGYRIQCATDALFAEVAADRTFDADQRASRAALGLKSGVYWCRRAEIDLLGKRKEWTSPKRIEL